MVVVYLDLTKFLPEAQLADLSMPLKYIVL